MASIAKPWFIFLFVVKPRLIYIHKGTYVIKTLCNWAQKWTWVILTDAEITVASLNSLRDLAFDCIIVIFLLQRGKQIKHVCGKSVYGNSQWPKTHKKRVVKKYNRYSHSYGISFLRESLSLLKNSR